MAATTECEWTPGVGDGQGVLACCDSWGRKESDTTERLNWTEGLLWTNVYLGLLPSFWLGFVVVVIHVYKLCILEIKPLLFVSFTNIFSGGADAFIIPILHARPEK